MIPFPILIALAAICAWAAIWSRRDSHWRWIGVLAFILAIPTIGWAYADSLGRHRPLILATHLLGGEHKILAAKFEENVRIWVYVDTGRGAPWPIELPWSTETADKIQRAMEKAPEGQEGQFMGRFVGEHSWNIELVPHPIPQKPALPPKRAPQAAPQLLPEL